MFTEKTTEIVKRLLNEAVERADGKLWSAQFNVKYKQSVIDRARSAGAKTRAQNEMVGLVAAVAKTEQDLADLKEALAEVEAS